MPEKKFQSIKIICLAFLCLFFFGQLIVVAQSRDKVPIRLNAAKAGILHVSAGSKAAAVTKKCRCVASTMGWSNPNVHDYGVIAEYPLYILNAPKKCSRLCSDMVSGRVSIENATEVCAARGWIGGCVRGYGYIGLTGGSNADAIAGKLVCTAPVSGITRQKCPAGWYCNDCSPSIDGGFTNDGKCKREVCVQDIVVPLPPNGTPIGAWGFTSGSSFYAWGTINNGGAPNTVIISPPVIGSGSWTTCP